MGRTRLRASTRGNSYLPEEGPTSSSDNKRSTENPSTGVSPAKLSKPNNAMNILDPAFDWQSTKMRLTERFDFIYNTERYADVHFIVGSGEMKKIIPAHKLVLSVGSTVFDAMFGDNWATANEIEIPDVEVDAFLALLKFLYTDEVEVTADTVMTVLYVAKKYAVQALENICLDFLSKLLDPSNVFTIMNQAKFFNETELVEKCLKIIDNNAAGVIKTSDFTNVDSLTLSFILKRDTLRISEYDLLQATLRWSEAECERQKLPLNFENQRSVLKEALYLIRFPLMSQTEFSSTVAKTGLLPDKELLSLFMYFSDKQSNKLPNNFIAKPRLPSYFVWNRFRKVSNRLHPCDGTPSSIRFIPQYDLQLEGIGMYGRSNNAAKYTVKFSVSTDGNDDVSYSWESSDSAHPGNEENTTFRLFLPSPIQLKIRNVYVFTFSVKGADSIIGQKGLRKMRSKVRNADDEEVIADVWPPTDDFSSGILNGQLPELLFTW